MRRLWLLAALAAASIHCGGEDDPTPPPDPTRDGDRDGVIAAEDCDDAAAERWQRLPGYLDVDGDGFGGGALAQVCSGGTLRAGWSTAGGDCDDADAARFHERSGYADVDGDGRPGGPEISLCLGAALPPGFGEVATDCAPADGGAWSELGYVYRDGDGDGFTVARAGTVCAGVSLPAGYSMDPRGDDCDDANPSIFARTDAFADGDRDGAGVAQGVVCAGLVLPPGWAAAGGDCDDADATRYLALHAYVDGDHDGVGVEPGTVCTGGTLPTGWAAYGGDCDDAQALAWETRSAYRDGDGDGRGGAGGTVCGSSWWLPEGWTTDGTDCDDANELVWAPQAYQYADRDGDRHAVPGGGSLCAAALPPELRASLGDWQPGDCDDADAERWWAVVLFADVDGDEVGAGIGESFCIGAASPEGYVASGSDCAPDDAARWQLRSYVSRDLDGDGHAVPANPTYPYGSGSVCSGTALPAGYVTTTATQPYDCDDAVATLWVSRQGAPDEDGDGWGAGPLAAVCSGSALPAGYGPHANDCATPDPTLWRWTVLYPDADGDGVGTPPRVIQCLGATIPDGWSEKGWDSNDADPGVQLGAGDQDPLALEL